MSKENEKSIFIGARTLEKEEVKIIVPTFDSMINRVEDIRREASNRYEGSNDKKIKKYNNTITLFGNRGTGKTSTMYTFRNELNKNKKNILLEIIEPDNIGQEGKIMGCILGLFKAEIDTLQAEIKDKKHQELSNEIKKYFFDDCRFKDNNPLKQAYNEVLEYYCYTEKDYKTLLISNYNDMNSYIKKSSHVFNADIEFSKKFEEFINEFIECKKNLNCDKKDKDNNADNEPLIFIFIDDVDLNTNKCQEIIESILKYASHPNIVCFITGDYNTFTEEFTISLLKKENLKAANLMPDTKINKQKTILECKQELAHEYMKKVFPPAYRHYVNTWDLSLIPEYRFAIEGSEKTENLFELLNTISNDKSIENIFGYYSENENKLVYFLPAYNMFDKTSRGLINVYYSLWNIRDNIRNYTSQEYFVNVKNLIENIIDSSVHLVKYNDEIKNRYILWGADEGQSKIDFEQLENFFQDEEQENIFNDRSKLEIKYSLFYICYYISILLPKIQYSKEKRKDIFKWAMLELVSNPKLNGYDININTDSIIKSYFLNRPIYKNNNYYNNYRYNIHFKEFICQILAEAKLSFSQKFYKNIVNSKLLGYEVFNEDYKVSEEKYNALYLVFYKSLYKDKYKDIPIIMDFYSNENLKEGINFLQIKSDEEKELTYIEEIFKEVFEGFNEKINLNVNKLKEYSEKQNLIKKKEQFLLLLKLQFKRICSKKNKSIIANDFLGYVKQIVNDYNEDLLIRNYKETKRAYKDTSKENIQDIQLNELNKLKKVITLAKSIYRIHENEIKNKNKDDDKKESFYTDSKIFQGITKEMTEVFGYELANIFLYNISIDEVYPNNNFFDGNERILGIDLSNAKIAAELNNFLKSHSGYSTTKAYETKNEVRHILNGKLKKSINGEIENTIEPISITEYYKLIKELNDLYLGNGWYCKKEAKQLVEALNNNGRIRINEYNIFSETEEWIIEAYSLFIQRAKPEVIDINELQEAKAYLKELLANSIEQQEAKEKEYLAKLGIVDEI